MNEPVSNRGTTRKLLLATTVLLCLVVLLQLGLLLQRHLSRPHSVTPPVPAQEIAWSPDDEIAAVHERINQIFHHAFNSPAVPHPPAAVSAPPVTSGGSAGSSFEDDPFAAMRRMQRQIDAVFAGSMGRGLCPPSRFDDGWSRLDITPGFSVNDKGDAYEITVQLPGVDKSDIHIQMNHSVLSLVIEHDGHTTTGADDHNRVQQSYHASRFERHLRLPGAVDTQDAIKATYSNGVLRVVVPKTPEANAVAAAIPIQ